MCHAEMEYPHAGHPSTLSSASPLVVDTPSPSSRHTRYAELRAGAPLVVPSILNCDFAHLADEVRKLEEGGAQALHLDVMDGHFVPNLSFGLPIVETVRRLTDLPIETHLMISNPAEYVSRYRQAGADAITFHCEVVDDPRPLLDEVRGCGALAGLAFNVETPVSAIRPYVDACDLVLVMSVTPGFGGQAFETAALDKLRQLREIVADHVILEVDGGVNDETIADCVSAGSHFHVVGSGIMKHPPYGQALARLEELATASFRKQ